jgi:hypothetical protein
MRLLGSALLVSGVLLCISIVWAAIGFFMMGLGLICLLIAEERSKRFQKSAAARLDESDATRKEPRLSAARTVTPVSTEDFFPDPINHSSNSEAEWKSLVEKDQELARLVAALAPYGQKYVDELARIYLVFKDKDYLPIIIKKIVMMARKDAGTDITGELTLVSNPNAEAAATKARRLREYRARALRTAYEVVADSSVLKSRAPETTADTGSPSSSQPSNAVHAGGEGAAERQAPRSDKSNATKAANATAVETPKEAKRVVYLDTDETLADLLSDLDLKTVLKAKQ